MKSAISACSVLLGATQAMAYSQSASCDAAAMAAAEAHGVPAQVMLAITRVETGRNREGGLQPWPWAVNQAGSPHWFDTPEEAGDFVRSALNSGSSNIDIGCFQLNLHWHGEHFPSVQAMLDPQQNADYAARFLMENRSRKGNWVDAVAAYHSATPANAEAYVEKVESVLTQLGEAGTADTTTAISAPPSNQPPPRSNRFPLLQPGASGTLASLMPFSQSAGALFAATP